MPSLFECRDPYGRLVRLDDRRFHTKIEFDHPELTGAWDRIEMTIRDPDSICEDANFPDRDCFYRKGGVPGRPNDFLKVCVGEDLGDPDGAIVITAYLTPKINGLEVKKWTK